MTGEDAVDLGHMIVERIKDVRKVAACGQGRGLGSWPAPLGANVSEGDGEVRRQKHPPGASLRDLDKSIEKYLALNKAGTPGSTTNLMGYNYFEFTDEPSQEEAPVGEEAPVYSPPLQGDTEAAPTGQPEAQFNQ